MLFLYSILTDPFISFLNLLFILTYSFVIQNTYLIISRDKPLLNNYISTNKYSFRKIFWHL